MASGFVCLFITDPTLFSARPPARPPARPRARESRHTPDTFKRVRQKVASSKVRVRVGAQVGVSAPAGSMVLHRRAEAARPTAQHSTAQHSTHTADLVHKYTSIIHSSLIVTHINHQSYKSYSLILQACSSERVAFYYYYYSYYPILLITNIH